MKYIKQFTIIAAVCLLGEVLYYLLPLPFPASIYGLVLMLAALLTGIIKLEQVETTADFFIQIMPVFFIPATSGLIEKFDALKAILVPFVITLLISLVCTFSVTGRVTQFFLRQEKQEEDR